MDRFSLDLAGMPKELRFILTLLKMDNDTDGNPVSHTEIDWDLFVDLAMHHRVFPVIYARLKMLDEGVIPAFVQKTLYNQYKRNTFQMLRLSAEMEQVSRLFSAEKVRLLFLKGPMLGHDLYGDISLRTSGDLDMLISINQLEDAEKLLLKMGYEKDDYFKTVLNDWKWRNHHVTFFHPEKRMKLEIHWRLNPGPMKEPGFNILWKRKGRSEITSYPIYTLKREDLFLFLLSHGARHGWSRLRWLIDIHLLMDQELDWQEIHNKLKKYNLLHIGGQGIILASQLLNAKIPNEAKTLVVNRRSEKLAEQALFYLESMINLHTEPVPENVARYHKRHLFSLMATQQRVCFILSFLYPYPEDAETLPLPKRLHFLYFPLRPFLWIWRKTRNHALS